jgi:hypothetical protein
MVNNHITKTCIICGLAKPMNAFLQIQGPEGTSYGNTCSTCRGSSVGKKVIIPENEEERSSSSSTGLKIDAKSKMQSDLEKKDAAQKQKELDKEERVKLEDSVDDKLETKEQKLQAEKKHREEYIEPQKKSSFLNFQNVKNLADTAIKQATFTQQARQNVEHMEAAQKQEEKDKKLDMVDDTDLSQSLEKFKSAEYKKVVNWLHKGAAINRQYIVNDPQKDPIDFVEKTFENETPKSPGSGRRR